MADQDAIDGDSEGAVVLLVPFPYPAHLTLLSFPMPLPPIPVLSSHLTFVPLSLPWYSAIRFGEAVNCRPYAFAGLAVLA